jgi:hypothetical protein
MSAGEATPRCTPAAWRVFEPAVRHIDALSIVIVTHKLRRCFHRAWARGLSGTIEESACTSAALSSVMGFRQGCCDLSLPNPDCSNVNHFLDFAVVFDVYIAPNLGEGEYSNEREPYVHTIFSRIGAPTLLASV